MKFCDVYVEDDFNYNQVLTYRSASFDVCAGVRVKVSLRHRIVVAFVVAVYDPIAVDFEVLPIVAVIDPQPVLNQELTQLARWMSEHCIASEIRCLQTILPNQLKPKSSFKRNKMIKTLVRTDKALAKLTARQHDFIARFNALDSLAYSEARKQYSGVKRLVDLGYFDVVDVEASYIEKPVIKETVSFAVTKAQKKAIETIRLDHFHTYLLHGVTGSGKTEVYLRLAQQVLDAKRQVLILVPEISLTPQMIQRVSQRFGQDVAVYHSALSDQEKYEQYLRVKSSCINVVVGTRSAVFLPFSSLGLIVVDEEHDLSYKQSNTPYYHGRDIAQWRSEFHNCPCVLGSASPSLESYARALRGVYTLVELDQRINHSFPKVQIVDTQKALYSQQSPYLSDPLIQAIATRIQRKEQVILLLNRRGYLTLLRNRETDEVLMCPNCDVALNYHKSDQSLKCHVCGYSAHQFQTADQRPMAIVGSGVGTQRLSEHLEKLFPQARVLRMDVDATRGKQGHKKLFDSFAAHHYDILVGTQMVSKGLDIEAVTLVGIINADTTLTYTDYRSVEITFSLLLQASGRSGRGKHEGEVIIQTANPQHYGVVYAVNQKYKLFFKQEMAYRKLAQYPPYQFLIAVVFQDANADKAIAAAEYFHSLIHDEQISLIGPALLRKTANRHRVRIIMKGKDLDRMKQTCRQAAAHYRTVKRTTISVDVNPLTLE